MHSRYIQFVTTAFERDSAFVEAIDKACRTVVNTKLKGGSSSKAAEYLAKMCDTVLKKSSKTAADSEADVLENLVSIFKYVDDKDVFQKFYAKMLGRRLIHQSSISEEAEISMIGRLKELCGYEYTSKLQRMLNDVRTSGDLASEFHSTAPGKALQLHFQPLVLQTGAWPLGNAQPVEISLPAELCACVNAFEHYYTQQRHSGRRLTWLYHLSNGDVKARIGKRTFELQATTYQITVLLLFNTCDELTRLEIEQQSGLAEKELDRVLRSLVTCHLVKAPGAQADAASFAPEDKFLVNLKFNSKKKRLKISSALQKETPSETQQTHKAIDEDRRLLLQAVAVRIMKMRKHLQYNILIDEIITQSSKHFKPRVPAIKKCIEELIEMQYIERDEGDHRQLHYMA